MSNSRRVKRALSFLGAVLLSAIVAAVPLTPTQAVESPKCNDLGYERLYGNSGGCLMSFSDKAYERYGLAFNPDIITCSFGRDSISFIYFPQVPKSGQLDGLGKVSFEFDYFNDCSTWPGAITFEAFLTDVNGSKYPLGEVGSILQYRDCPVSSSCFPYVFGVNEARGEFDVSGLRVEGYYRFSIQVKRDLTTATPSERYSAGQEKNMLVEYSNQLWLGSPKKAPKPIPSPAVPDCRASKDMNLLFSANSPLAITQAQRSKIAAFLKAVPKSCTNGEAIKLVECIGSYSTNKNRSKVETRTKNSCAAVKKMYPKSTTFVSVKKNYSIDNWVTITAYYQK